MVLLSCSGVLLRCCLGISLSELSLSGHLLDVLFQFVLLVIGAVCAWAGVGSELSLPCIGVGAAPSLRRFLSDSCSVTALSDSCSVTASGRQVTAMTVFVYSWGLCIATRFHGY